MAKAENSSDDLGFSLVLGGPLYQLLVRSRLSTPTLQLMGRRIAVFILVTWVPPAVLSAIQGTFLRGAAVPFLYDLSVHVKFLVSLPLLLLAEVIVHRRLR